MPDGAGQLSLADQTLLFNLAPVGYTHMSWYDTLPYGTLCRTLSDRADGRPWVSQYLLEAQHVDTAYFTDFSEPRARIVLIGRKFLESLLLYVGVTLRSEEVRTEIDGRRLALFQRRLGRDVIDYAKQRAVLAGPIPEFDYEPAVTDPRLRFLMIGAAYSLSPRATGQTAYLRRVALMLPQDLSKKLADDLPQEVADPDNTGLPSVTRRIVKEFLPQWRHLFD